MTNLDIISQIRILKNREVNWLGPSHTGNPKDVRVFTQPYPTLSTPQTAVHQAPLSMGFPRQEYWNCLPLPPPRDLPNPGFELVSLASAALAGRFLTTAPPGKYHKGRGTLLQQEGSFTALWLGGGEEAWCFQVPCPCTIRHVYPYGGWSSNWLGCSWETSLDQCHPRPSRCQIQWLLLIPGLSIALDS